MNKSSLNLILGLVGGALVGAATALLLAPETGEDMRKIIKEKYDDMNKKSKEEMDKLKVKIEELKKNKKDK